MTCCQCRSRPSVLSVYWDRSVRLCARCAHVTAFSRDHAQTEADHPPYHRRPDAWWDLWVDRIWPQPPSDRALTCQRDPAAH